MPRNVIVDRNGGVDVHVAVKDNEYDNVNGHDQAHKDVTNRQTCSCSAVSVCPEALDEGDRPPVWGCQAHCAPNRRKFP